MMNILVVGGAGHIGSHMFELLGQQGCRVTTLDDLSSGHRVQSCAATSCKAILVTVRCWMLSWPRGSMP